MATRAELYQLWGAKLMEAVVLLVKDEINILRQREGLAPRDNQQLIDAIWNKIQTLPDYPWQGEP